MIRNDYMESFGVVNNVTKLLNKGLGGYALLWEPGLIKIEII